MPITKTNQLLCRNALNYVLLHTQKNGIINLVNTIPYQQEYLIEQLAERNQLKASFQKRIQDYHNENATKQTAFENFQKTISITKQYQGGDCATLSYLVLEFLHDNGAYNPRLVYFLKKSGAVGHACVAFNSPLIAANQSILELNFFKMKPIFLSSMVIVDPWLNFFCSASEYFATYQKKCEESSLATVEAKAFVKVSDWILENYFKISIENPYHSCSIK